jgi:epoxyqueuosine reductase
MTSTEVKSFARSAGADLVGIAPVERFGGAPAGHLPRDILAGARSVVSLALRIPAGVLHGPATSYQAAMNAAHAGLDRLGLLVALFIEESGGRAVPVPADEPYRHWVPERSYGRGDLSHKHAAQAAGLGRLGKNSLLITPEFGNMVHLTSVVTDAELEPDPVSDWEPCPKGCERCIRACPAGAIEEGTRVNQAACRPVVMQRLPKGYVVEGCWACRKACPKAAAPRLHG